MLRTHDCGALRASHADQTVTLTGRTHKIRKLGGLTFIDLRDRYGLTQIVADETRDPEIKKILDSLHPEFCLQITGVVTLRPAEMKNPDLPTGDIELHAHQIKILSRAPSVLPFPVVDDPATSEEIRLKNRFLDLRRRPVLRNLEFRATMNKFTRDRFSSQNFLEIPTPIFTSSTPEWARDFVVPSRVHPGHFYALPQAPQQFKQLLMVGGIDRYFQIAPCFRDEDPRADRAMCEFYQIDFEMSFVEQEDVLQTIEKFTRDLVAQLVPHKKLHPVCAQKFPRLSYADAMARFGSDKPDLRFGLEFQNCSEIFANSEFQVFQKILADAGEIKALKISQIFSRKEIDEFQEIARESGAGGLPRLALDGDELRGSFAKFLSDSEKSLLQKNLDRNSGETLLFACDSPSKVAKTLNKLRLHLRDRLALVSDDELAFCFVLDFPFYEFDETTQTRDFGHNPFSAVQGGLDALSTQEISQIMTRQYDLALNGFELGSGSIRNHDPEILLAVFEKIGRDRAEIAEKFGAMADAFKFSPPPHGGFAFGFDRLMMILLDEPNIRDCYAFPKAGRAQDFLMGCPTPITQPQLDELGLEIQKSAKNLENNPEKL